MELTNTRFYVGTARGLLLSTSDKPTDIKVYKNTETSEVTAISEGRDQDELLVGYASGNVHFFDIAKNAFTKTLNKLDGDEGVCGIACRKSAVVVGKRDGIINLWSKKSSDFFSLNLDEAGTLNTIVLNQSKENILGTGGEVNDFKLWDLETKQCVFKAKSLGHDHLQLPIPTSVRGITFFNDSPSLAACCTKEGHVLLYDDRAQRRPVVTFLEPKASYTTISTAYRETQVLVGTCRGYLQWLDLKQPPKVLKTYTTFTGSVTDIVCDPLEPFVASVSLDRHLRVHNMDTKQLVSKFYMKQNLTKLLVRPVVKDESEEVQQSKEVDQEYEELFKNMEEIQEGDEVSKDKKVKRKGSKNESKVKVKKLKKSKKVVSQA